MKTLLLALALAAVTYYNYAPKFAKQMLDYKKSDACVGELVSSGVERSAIEVVGPDCWIKG